MCRVPDQFVRIAHILKWNVVFSEKLQSDSAVVPASVTTSPVFADKIVLGELVSKVVFDTGSAAHQSTPERLLADFVWSVDKFTGSVFAIEALVTYIGTLSVGGAAGFIKGDDPGTPGFCRLTHPFHGLTVGVFDVAVLKGTARQNGAFAEQRAVNRAE